MSGPQDLTLEVREGSKGLSLFLADVGAYFRGELAARGGDITVPRLIAKLFALALPEAANRAEVLEETSAVCTRLERVVRSQEAEITLLRVRIRELERGQRPALSVIPGGVVDLADAFGRETRANRPGGEGGAA